jgi:hypothetical protein
MYREAAEKKALASPALRVPLYDAKRRKLFVCSAVVASTRDESAQKNNGYFYRLIYYMIVCVFMLSIAIKNLLYFFCAAASSAFLYIMAETSIAEKKQNERERGKNFKSTNFYRE